MSYNDISYSFSQYPKGISKNCKHLKELFNQAAMQLEEEQEIPIIVKKEKIQDLKMRIIIIICFFVLFTPTYLVF